MFEKTSKYVIATVVFDDGAVLVEQAHTTDGIWRTDKKVLGGTVVAWMDYPKPYKETDHDYILIRIHPWNHIRSGRSCMCSDHVRQAPPRRLERRTVC